MSQTRGTTSRGRFVLDRVFDERPLNSGLLSSASPEQSSAASVNTAAMLERARREGFEQGLVHGRDAAFKEAIAAAQQSIESKSSETLSAIETQIGQMLNLQSQAFTSLVADGERLLQTIVQRMMPELARRGEVDEIVGVLRLGMSIACNDPVLELRVAPSLVDRVKILSERAAKGANFSGRIDIDADPDLAPGATRVRWTHGSAARDPQATLATIQGILNSHFGLEAALADMAARETKPVDQNDQ
jgi:flagellar biosynthesis/type III secretory pathway protein FliH